MHGGRRQTIWVMEENEGRPERRREKVSGELLSWRDDPEKSGLQNGLPEKEVYSIGRRRQRRRQRRRRRWRLQVFICYTEQCGSRNSGCAGVLIQSTWTRSRKKWCRRAHQQHYVSERRLINEHLLPREHKIIWRQTLRSSLPKKKNERAVRGRRVNVEQFPLNGTFRRKSECKIDFLLFVKVFSDTDPKQTQWK